MKTLPEKLANRIKAVHSNLERAEANRGLAELNLNQAKDRLGNAKHFLTIGDRLFGGWAINNERLKEVTNCKDQLRQASEAFQESVENYKEQKQLEQTTLSDTLLMTDEDYGTLKLALARLTNLEISLQNLAQTVKEISPAVKSAVSITRKQLDNISYSQVVAQTNLIPEVVRSEAYAAFSDLQRVAEKADEDINDFNALQLKLGQKPLSEAFAKFANKAASEDAALVTLYSNGQPRLDKFSIALHLNDLAIMNYAVSAIDATVIRTRFALQKQQTLIQQELVQKESAVLKQALSL